MSQLNLNSKILFSSNSSKKTIYINKLTYIFIYLLIVVEILMYIYNILVIISIKSFNLIDEVKSFDFV